MKTLLGKILVSAILLLVVIVGLVVAGELEYRVNLSDSIPRGLYKVTHESVTRGVFVAECLPLDLVAFAKERDYLQPGRCPGDVMQIFKEVVGVEGDEVELTPAYVAVNGRLILNSETRESDSKGRPIPAVARGKFVVQRGEVFLLGTNSARSWDGRNLGPTQITNLIATLQPVWAEATNGE